MGKITKASLINAMKDFFGIGLTAEQIDQRRIAIIYESLADELPAKNLQAANADASDSQRPSRARL